MDVHSTESPQWSERAGAAATVVVAVLVVSGFVAFVPGAAAATSTGTNDGGDRGSRGIGATPDDPRDAVLGPALRERVVDASPGERVDVLVLFEEQPDVEHVAAETSSRAELARRLEERTRRIQRPVLATLRELRARGDVSSYRRLWLVNAVAVTATPDAVRRLADAPGVAAVVADVDVRVSDASGDAGPNSSVRDAARDGHATVTIRDESERPVLAPTSLDASAAVGLPAGYRVPDRPLPIDPGRSPVPTTVGRPAAVPPQASAPFDGDDLAWGVERIHADAARRAGFDGSGVTVAVIDTGIDDSHPDLDEGVVGWKDFVNGFANPYDDNGHGTHVAGTVAGDGDGGLRTGVAPGVDLLGVKVLDGGGRGQLSTIVQGMEWAVAHDADVLSLSLGGPHDPLIHAVANRAADAGVVPVVAAGNFGGSREPFTVDLQNLLEVTDPGHVSGAVTVGATHWQDSVAWFSARERIAYEGEAYTKPDVAAPGQGIASADAGTDGYARSSGTSMATPHVAGVAALVLQAEPGTTAPAFKELLGETAADLGPPGFDDAYGAGRVDARAAVVAAGEADELAVDVAVDEATGPTVTVAATLTGADGNPAAGENVSIAIVSGPRERLEAHKAEAGLYAFADTRATDANGTVTFRAVAPQARTIPNGTFTIEISANGGLTRHVTEIQLANEVDVSVTPLNRSVLHNGDVGAFAIAARNASGAPVDATVRASLHGPTGAGLRGWTETVRLGPDGNETVRFGINESLVAIHGGPNRGDAPRGGPSVGRYGIATVAVGVDGSPIPPDLEVHPTVATVETRWTDLEFNQPETALTRFQDIQTWQGEVTIGETVAGSLDTTDPGREYRIGLVNFSATPLSATTLATVTTGDDGTASFEATVPPSLPGGYYAVVAVPEGRNLTAPGPTGAFDTGFVYVQALQSDISIRSREDANNQAFQPGEAVRVTVVTRNASTGERVDPERLSVDLFGFTGIAAVERTAPGTIEVNTRLDDSGLPTGMVHLSGWDQNGGRFSGHDETVLARHFTVDVQPRADRYEAGENATIDVRIADAETGEPIRNAEVRVVVTGLSTGGTWVRNRTVKTDGSGSGSVTVEIPSNAVEIEFLASDVIVELPSIEKGPRRGLSVTGFDLIETGGPSIDIAQEGAEEIGLYGLQDVATFEPGQRIPFVIDARGLSSSDPGYDRSVDVLAIKLSRVGDGRLVFDANESDLALVRLDRSGRATYTYTMSDHPEAGFLIPIALTGFNGMTLSDTQVGIVGSRPVAVETNRSAVRPGGRVRFSVTGALPPAADVDFVVKRRGSDGQFPLTSLESESGLAAVLSQRDRTLRRADPIVETVLQRLPERSGDREAIGNALRGALVPAMTRALTARTPGGAIDVGVAAASSSDGGERTIGTSYRVPENLPPGEYRVIAIVHSDDGVTVKEQIGFATFTVRE